MGRKYQSHILKIASWNVHGLKKKCKNTDFLKYIDEYDVCFISETWITEKFCLPGKYVFIKNALKKKNKSGGRCSGGIAVIINEKLKSGIKIMKECNCGIWLKLDRNFFKFEHNMYICGLYLPPSNSTYAIKVPYDAIERDIVDRFVDGKILLVGDTNSRTVQL